jgi:hypothetical protein
MTDMSVGVIQGLQSVCVGGGGGKLSAEGVGTVGGPVAFYLEKILKFGASETPFRAFWGKILQIAEDYNIIIRSRIPASAVIRLRIISWT